MRISSLLLASMLVFSFDASASRPCETNYSKSGTLLKGRQFSTWAVIPGASPADVFRRLQSEGVKSGLRVAHADAASGILNFEQTVPHRTSTVTLPWNIVVESEGDGSKVTVSKSTPATYMTSESSHQSSMCSVIESAQPRS